jgi:hypothetical protein
MRAAGPANITAAVNISRNKVDLVIETIALTPEGFTFATPSKGIPTIWLKGAHGMSPCHFDRLFWKIQTGFTGSNRLLTALHSYSTRLVKRSVTAPSLEHGCGRCHFERHVDRSPN